MNWFDRTREASGDECRALSTSLAERRRNGTEARAVVGWGNKEPTATRQANN